MFPLTSTLFFPSMSGGIPFGFSWCQAESTTNFFSTRTLGVFVQEKRIKVVDNKTKNLMVTNLLGTHAKKNRSLFLFCSILVTRAGFEPARCEALPPQDSVSSGFTTGPKLIFFQSTQNKQQNIDYYQQKNDLHNFYMKSL